MKTSKNILQIVNGDKAGILKQQTTGKVLKSMLVLFILSWVSLLSSCVVAVPNQRYQRHPVIVEHEYRGEHHDNGRHRGWYKHHDRDDNHERGDRDDN